MIKDIDTIEWSGWLIDGFPELDHVSCRKTAVKAVKKVFELIDKIESIEAQNLDEKSFLDTCHKALKDYRNGKLNIIKLTNIIENEINS